MSEKRIQQIKHNWNGSVIFECEIPKWVNSGMAMRHALEKAARARVHLRHAELYGADLRDADLRGAYLHYADLSGADLRNADLRHTDLRRAILSGADLRDADLRNTDLRHTILSGADLHGANLNGADLSVDSLRDFTFCGADLRGADLRGVDGKPLPPTTPEQAISNLDKVREIILDNDKRLNMDYWHESDDWQDKTCAEEILCGTAHCLAGWLQVCSTEPALKWIFAAKAGALAAPIAVKMFHRDQQEVLEWLRERKYVAETEEFKRRDAEWKVRREAKT